MFCLGATAVRCRLLVQALDERFVHISNQKICHIALQMLFAINDSTTGW